MSDRVLLAALALACRGPSDGGDGAPDAEADTDTDTDADADTDADTDGVPDTDGYAIVVMEHGLYGDRPFFVAQFYEVIAEPVVPADLGVPAVPDTCRTAVYTSEDLAASDPGEIAHQPAGSLSLAGPVSVSGLAPDALSDWLYSADLDPASFEYGSTWSVEAAGDVFPAFSFPDALEVPADLRLSSPAGGFALDGPLDLAWSGGDADLDLTVRLSVANSVAGVFGNVVCLAANDGAFTVPRDALDPLPGGTPVLHVEHLRRAVVEVADRPIRLDGAVVTLMVGSP